MKFSLIIASIAVAIFISLNVEAGPDGCDYPNKKTCVKNGCIGLKVLWFH